MTIANPHAYVAKPVIRRVPVDPNKPAGEQRETWGWQCGCGSNEGPTVLATEDDAQNAADLHVRSGHPSTWIGALAGLSQTGTLKVGTRVLGDAIKYVQVMADGSGTYFETAAGGRYTVDEQHRVRPYVDAATRPE